MSNTSKISRSVISALITVCLLMSLIPGGVLRADGMKRYLFASLQETESGIYVATDAYWSESDVPEEGKDNYELLGPVYTGYESGDNITISGDEPFCLNAAVVKYNGNYNPDLQFVLLGSTLIFNNVTLISKSGAVNGAGDAIGFANTLLERSQDIYEYKVESGKTFTITAHSDNAGSIVETDKLVVNGTVNVADCASEDMPNLLRILDNGTLTAGAGSITGSGNALLEICRGVKVTGGLKLYDSDGSELDLTNAFEATETFHWDTGVNGWKMDGHGPNNDFTGVQVRYDDHVISDVKYSLDGTTYSALPEGSIIDPSTITSTVYFKVTPKEGEENSTFELSYVDGPDFEVDEKDWQWTPIEPHTGDGIVFGVAKSLITKEQFVLDIHTIGGAGPQDPEGWAIYYDQMDIASVSYQIGTGAVVAANDDYVIGKDDYKDASSITFKVTLTDDNRTIHYRVYEYDNDQVAIAEGDFSKDNLTAVVSAGEGTFGDKSYVIDIRNQGAGPITDYEGIQVRFDEHSIDNVQYAIDNGDFQDVPDDRIIPTDAISNCTSIKFKAIPKQGQEDGNFALGYINNPDFEHEDQWEREYIDRDEGSEIVFTVNKSLITSDKFLVDIVPIGGFDPNYKGINVGYDDNRISNVQYSVDNGTFQDLPNDHIIPADTVNNCTTNIRFKIVPQTNEENRNYVLDYVDGPDYDVGDDTWNWTRITHDEGDNYTFTVDKSYITEDQFAINIFADDGAPFDGFEIQTIISAGRGTVEITPGTVIDSDGWIADNHMRYNIAFDNYNAFSVVITPHADDVVTYMVKSISVSGISEDDYEIVNNVLTLKSKPTANTSIVITVEFGVSDDVILSDVAERGYAYTIIISSTTNPQDIIDEAKGYLTTELWNYYFGNDRIYNGIFASKNDLADAITKVGLSPAAPDNDVNNPIDPLDINYCPYIDFKLAIDEGSSVALRVYLLQKLGFYVKTPKADNSGYDYYFAEYKPNDQGFAEDIVLAFDHDVGNAQIFGNGVDMEGVILTDSHDVFSGHVHQERTQLFHRDDANYISVRLVLVNIPNPLATTAVRINGNQSCPGWEFDRMNIYTASANRGNATDAYIYIGSTEVELDEVVFANSNIGDKITAVELDGNYGLSNGIIKVTQRDGKFVVSFLDSNNKMTTNYDFIPLRLSIKDSNNQTTFKYLNLHRVALRIDKYDDAGNVHIKGTYYYPTLNSAPSDADKVDLYVTVTRSDGTKETMMVDGSNVQVKCSDDQQGNPNFNPYYSEFDVWTGSESDFGQIEKVEIIVISRAGNDDTHFGGVKAGFGAGVVWVKG